MRHAKSSWADAGMDDFDRPLNHRGRETAPKMGEWLKEHDFVPDLVLSSTAVRAKQTTDLVVEALGGSVDIQWHPDLYLSTPATMQAKVAEVPSSVSKVLLIAHNPGLEELVQWVIGGHESFPTAAVACFECDSDDWSTVYELNRWKLKEVVRPKEM